MSQSALKSRADVAKRKECKVLFLDIDGVCNSRSTLQRSQRSGSILGMDGYLSFLVGKIQLDTDCKIVLSSSWRHSPDGLAEVKAHFDLYGITPSSGSGVRGNEIQAWLNEHPEVTRYAIVDDDADMLSSQLPNFFKTTFEFGITTDIAQAITEHLNEVTT
jgi:hypothetical protein